MKALMEIALFSSRRDTAAASAPMTDRDVTIVMTVERVHGAAEHRGPFVPAHRIASQAKRAYAKKLEGRSANASSSS